MANPSLAVAITIAAYEITRIIILFIIGCHKNALYEITMLLVY